MLFTDIEGSTQLLQTLGPAYATLLEEHRCILRDAFAAHDGFEDRTEGDSFFVVFRAAADGVAAALAGQLALNAHLWPDDVDFRVRMGLHTGDVVEAGGGYVGMAVHAAARVGAVGHGGQILVTDATRSLAPTHAEYLDLGSYSLKDLIAPVRLYQMVHPDLPASFPPLRSHGSSPHNLPAFTTAFLGRDDELADLRATLERSRLVTITGAGGAGKTRTAIRLGADVLEDYADGVWLVELAPVTAGHAVRGALAQALPIPDGATDPVNWLRERQVLVVVDNCEHLVEAAAALSEEILRSCPGVRVVTTSREPLGVQGEVSWRLPSMGERDAVALFVERAVAANSRFESTETNPEHIKRLCQELDGIPLTIELAAARTGAMSVEQVADRLGQRFRLLTGGNRLGVARQRTLQATVDWSYELLSESEQLLLRRLGVFTGATLEAITQACTDDSLDEFDVIDLLSGLVSKSLVELDSQRYYLHETIRQYALDKLTLHGELEGARDRHLRWAMAHAQACKSLFETAESGWRPLQLAELQNFGAAMDWASATDRPNDALAIISTLTLWGTTLPRDGYERLKTLLDTVVPAPTIEYLGALVLAILICDRLEPSYSTRVHEWADKVDVPADAPDEARVLKAVLQLYGLTDGMRRGEPPNLAAMSAAADQVAARGGPWKAVAYFKMGDIYLDIGDYVGARAAYEKAANASVHDESMHFWPLAMLSRIDVLEGHPEDALRRAEQALSEARTVADLGYVRFARKALATAVANLGDLERATALVEENYLEMTPEQRDSVQGVAALNNLAWNLLWLGKLDEANLYSQQGIALGRRFEANLELTLLHTAGEVARSQGRFSDAATLFFDLCGPENLQTRRESLESFAGLVFVARRRADLSARLYGAADATGPYQPDLIPQARDRRETDLASAKADLGSRWEVAFSEGKAMSPESVMELAQQAVDACNATTDRCDPKSR